MFLIVYFFLIQIIFLSSWANECISSKDVFFYFKDEFKPKHMLFNFSFSFGTSCLVWKALNKQSNKNKFLGTIISGASVSSGVFFYSFYKFSHQLKKYLFDGESEQENCFFPTVPKNEKKRNNFFSKNKQYFSVLFNKVNELPQGENYKDQERKNIKFFLNVLKNIDENDNFKECINKDLSKFLNNIFFCLYTKIFLQLTFSMSLFQNCFF